MLKILKHLNSYKNVLAAIIILAMLKVQGCSGDDDGNISSLKERLQNKTWKLESAKVDGAVTDQYVNLILKFSEATYESGGEYGMFEQSGTWTEKVVNKSIVFDGEFESEVIVQGDERVTLKFDWDDTTYGQGRTRSVSGAHEFVMIVQ